MIHHSQFRQEPEKFKKISELIPESYKSDDEEIVLRICKNQGVKFTDPTFKPGIRALVGDMYRDMPPAWRSLKWARTSDLFKDQARIFNDIDPCDIHQGLLGDCYFLCCLSSLAEQPGLIQRLFDSEELNPFCVNSAWLNINGMWTEVTMDDYIPVKPVNGGVTLAFSRTYDKELWVMLLEKAYAKVYGGYLPIEGGDPCYAMRDLTGAPYARFDDLHDIEFLWSRLTSAFKRNWIVTCVTAPGQTREEMRNTGIVGGHAYAILDAQDVVNSKGEPAKIIQIRNPWGKVEWNGNWCDQSPLWTQDLKDKFKIARRNDGVFWMSIEDFADNFDQVAVCMVEKDFYSDAVVVDMKQSNKSIVVFTLNEESDVTISLDQMDRRSFKNANGYRYSYMRISVGRISDDDIQFVDCQMSCARSVFISETLPEGNYVVLIEGYWITSHTRRVTVGVYSSSRPKMAKADMNDDIYERAEYMLWANFARNNREALKTKGNRVAKDGDLSCPLEIKELSGFDFGITLQGYFNDSEANSSNIRFAISQIIGFDPLFEIKNQNGTYELTINPSDVEVIVFKINPLKRTYRAGLKTIEEFLSVHKIGRDIYVLGYLSMLINRSEAALNKERKLYIRDPQGNHDSRRFRR